MYLLSWAKTKEREHSKEDLGNSLKKINSKELSGPFDLFEWVLCALLSEISWHIYRPCQRENERIKVVRGGRQLNGPHCKKTSSNPCVVTFSGLTSQKYLTEKDNLSLCFKLTPDSSHQIYLTVSSWERWDQTWEFMSAAAISLPDAPQGQTTKCLLACRGLFSTSQIHWLRNSWQ